MFAHQQNRNRRRGNTARNPGFGLYTRSMQSWFSALRTKRIGLLVGVAVLSLAILMYWRSQQTGVILASSQAENNPLSTVDAIPVDRSVEQPGETPAEGQPTTVVTTEPADQEPRAGVCVHVSGAVNDPGVVVLAGGSRLIDAVNSCGGLADDAAPDFINLAVVLDDGVHFYIPRLSDIEALREQGISPEQGLLTDIDIISASRTSQGTPGGQSPGGVVSQTNPASATGHSQQTGFPVDINNADMTALQTVPGIGPVTAQRIIDYRMQHGRFQSLDDLLLISGIGNKRLADMRPYLVCR